LLPITSSTPIPPGLTASGLTRPTPEAVFRFAEKLVTDQPDLCRLAVVGRSRQGRPLHLLTVGTGKRHVLVVAGAHPNEYVGGATICALADHLTATKTQLEGTTWHFLLCLDPDGAYLNDHSQETLRDYYRGFYRPAVWEQPEWAPSVLGAVPMPETHTLLDVIAEHRPVVQVSLHATDVGGTYAQLTRHVEGFAQAFAASAGAANIPLETGTLDAWRWPTTGAGIYVLPPPSTPERPTAFPEDAHHSTWLAPHAYGGTTAVIEVPAWSSTRVSDAGEHPDPQAAMDSAARLLRSLTRDLTPHIARAHALIDQADRDATAALSTALLATVQVCAPLADSWDHAHRDHAPMPGMSRAHAASLELFARRIPLRAGAMLMHLVSLPAYAGLQQTHPAGETLEQLVERWCEAYAASFQATAVPVQDQVGHHVRATLALVEHTELHIPEVLPRCGEWRQ
jgi:hypothetical protein